MAGRDIRFSVDGPAGIQAMSEVANISFEKHNVIVAPERLLLDGKERAHIPATVSKVEVIVANTTLTVMADGTNLFTTEFAR